MFGASDEIYDLNQKLTELAKKCDQYRNERDAFKIELEETKARIPKIIEGRKRLCDEIEMELIQVIDDRDKWKVEFNIMEQRAEKAETCDAEAHERARTKLGDELKQALKERDEAREAATDQLHFDMKSILSGTPEERMRLERDAAKDLVAVLERGIRECEGDGGCRGTKYLPKETNHEKEPSTD
jgi:chromosome segregation ATPase